MNTASMLGAYGGWARETCESWERELSFLHPRWDSAERWREAARPAVRELLLAPGDSGPGSLARAGRAPAAAAPPARTLRSAVRDGLQVEELSWQLAGGPPTRAVLLKPAGARGRLPAVLALHDHGGMKYFGLRKVTRAAGTHPSLEEHRRLYYGGTAWADELARCGFTVLVHDVFPFGSRRIMAADLPGYAVERLMSAPLEVSELTPETVRSETASTEYEVPAEEPAARIHAYDAFGARHEEVVAKSLFCAGLSWAGVCLAEDAAALEVLCARPDVEAGRIGCCGLSGGGMRTNALAGLDDRVRCSVTAGYMSTWADFLFRVSFTHSWMLYVPGLPRLMEYAELLGLRAPLPALVLATREDPLFTLEEVQRAAGLLESVYRKAGAPEAFRFSLYPGPHQFDRSMQEEAFQWLERWLR